MLGFSHFPPSTDSNSPLSQQTGVVLLVHSTSFCPSIFVFLVLKTSPKGEPARQFWKFRVFGRKIFWKSPKMIKLRYLSKTKPLLFQYAIWSKHVGLVYRIRTTVESRTSLFKKCLRTRKSTLNIFWLLRHTFRALISPRFLNLPIALFVVWAWSYRMFNA